jgi:coatomer protein complex subunit gamma
MAEEILKEVEKGIADFFSDGKDDDDEKPSENPYMNLEKSAILQSARDFHDSNVVREKPEEIITTITQLLHLQNGSGRGGGGGGKRITQSGAKSANNTNGHYSESSLTSTEATDIFFGVTKLFVSTNHKLLRRMVYVILKDLVTLCHPSDVIIVTSCLTKDMTSKDPIYRANALRVLARIIDTSMLSAIERYIKQAILESASSTPSPSPLSKSLSSPSLTLTSEPLSPASSFKKHHQHALVSSAALVSSLYLFMQSNENASIVKKWVNEVYEALRSTTGTGSNMVQFHALILFYQMKKSDRLAISKFVQKFCTSTMSMMDKTSNKLSSSSSSSMVTPSRRSGTSTRGNASSNNGSNVPSLQSPLAITCLIRYTFKLLHEEIMEGRISSFTHAASSSSSQLCSIGYQFLTSCLRHESEMVAFEAASSICSLSTTSVSTNELDNAASLEDIQPALSVLQLLLSSHKPAARLGTIKLLYKLSIKYPQFVCGRFNDSLEALIGDSNRLIGTLSIMTLMKTFAGGNGSNGDNTTIDRLLKHISSFVSHIADEYKIMVITSLENLCISYPMKFSIIISFLSKFLRQDGGFEFKRTIISSIQSLMEAIPETRDLALLYLCEFIEDCEYVALSTQILTLLGNLGPSTTSPARYVRFIFNRCILENAMIRAASVTALSKFGAGCPSLRSSILTLLRSCAMDENDETRDRVILAISILEDEEERRPYVPSLLDNECVDTKEDNVEEGGEENSATFLLMTKLPCSFDNLERRLKSYKETPGAMESDDALTLSTLPVVEDITPEEHEIPNNQSSIIDSMIGGSLPKNVDSNVGPDAINNIPEFAAFGRVFRSSKPIPLTETETEYVVHCVKHIFDQHVVLQFITQNTVDDQQLGNVSVCVESDNDCLEVTGELPAEIISYGASVSCFTVLERNPNATLSSCVFNCELKFTIVQVDPTTGEEEGESYEEEYPLEDLDLSISDFIAQTAVSDFRRSWESIGNAHEMLQKFSLQEKDVASAVKAVIDCMGMKACDGTHTVKPSAKQHMLHLSGTFLGGATVVSRAQVSLAPSKAIILKIATRSGSDEVTRMVSQCLG